MNPAISTPHPTAMHRTYGSSPSNAITLGLIHRHQLHTASSADYLFNLGHYSDCAALCLQILSSTRLPAEAIQARCHMYLATEGVGYADVEEDDFRGTGKGEWVKRRMAWLRLQHAEKAVGLWDVVVERRGESRFPVEKAGSEREEARALVEAARAGVLALDVQDEGDGGERVALSAEVEDGSEEGEIVQKSNSPYLV